MATKLLGIVSFAVSMDDRGRLDIRRELHLEPEFEVPFLRLTEAEKGTVYAGLENAAKLSGKVLHYIAVPEKRLLLPGKVRFQ